MKHSYRNGLHKRLRGKRHGKARKVIQYDLQGNLIKTWDSIMDIQRESNINNRSICSCCKGKRKTAGGYMWRYKEENYE